MKLYGSPTSPYVRKARVLISEKKLPVEFINEDPWPADSKIPSRNPLGKVPALEI
ncbi:MAG: glutathione S-transferase N-terminal domain-containing protein, partial [Burkholderiales bacterium]